VNIGDIFDFGYVRVCVCVCVCDSGSVDVLVCAVVTCTVKLRSDIFVRRRMRAVIWASRAAMRRACVRRDATSNGFRLVFGRRW
jgi:hypothetical protein